MLEELSQETVTEYANNALTIQEPQGTDYTQGVKVGKTVPAKWWNWLFNAVTKRLGQSKTDAQGMLSELQNTVIDAGIELDSSDNTQLSQAVVAKTGVQINKYITQKRGFFTYWTEVPGIPAKPNTYYTRNTNYIDECYVISDIYADGGAWTVHTSPDLIHWSTLNFGVSSSCVDQNITLAKYNGRYFMLRQLKYNADTQHYLNMWLYVSDDALNWTEIRAWSFYHHGGVSSFSQACLFVTESRIGVIGVKGSVTSQVDYFITTSSDGVNWSTDTSLDVTTNSAYYSFSPSVHVSLVIQGYDFDTGFILGNGFVNGSNVVTKLYQPSGERHDNWTPRIPVFKLSSGLFVFQVSTFSNGTLNWYTAPSTGSSPTVTARTYPDSSATGYYYKLDGDVIMRKITDKVAEYSLDGINFTALSESIAKVGTNIYVNVYQSGDTYYCGKYKSTDMVNWQEISVPEGSINFRVVRVVPEVNIVIGHSGNLNTTFVSDSGNPWEQSSIVISAQPVSAHSNKQLFRVNDVYFNGFFATSSGINKRIGYTLYLR